MESDIRIVERKELNLEGAVLVEGFPSVGMVSSIVANYMIKILDMEYVGSVRSRHFNPASIIAKGVPMPPVRIYAGQPVEKKDCICEHLVVLTSEFPPPVELMQPLVDNILEWTQEKGVDKIISIEGIINESADHENGGIYAIASSGKARRMLEDKGIVPMENGIITGISGVLLHEAELQQKDVICLLSDANPKFPDARAAARLIEELDKFLPRLKLDPQPLFEEAERLEEQIRQAMNQARTVNQPLKSEPPMMYG